jgi:hypothetical protein
VKDSAANDKADEDNLAWMANCLSESDLEDDDLSPILSTNISLDDLLEADENL